MGVVACGEVDGAVEVGYTRGYSSLSLGLPPFPSSWSNSSARFASYLPSKSPPRDTNTQEHRALTARCSDGSRAVECSSLLAIQTVSTLLDFFYLSPKSFKTHVTRKWKLKRVEALLPKFERQRSFPPELHALIECK
jgi:hypothetical protein